MDRERWLITLLVDRLEDEPTPDQWECLTGIPDADTVVLRAVKVGTVAPAAHIWTEDER